MDIQTLLIGGINALAGAVVFLFALFRVSYKKLERAVEAKEKKQDAERVHRDRERGKMQRRIDRLERLVGWFKNCPMVGCPYSRTVIGIREHEDGEREDNEAEQWEADEVDDEEEEEEGAERA